MLGGIVAWVGTGKSVELRVDGDTRKLHTSASNVGDVLADAGIKVDEHDIVAPDLSSAVKNGSEVVVRRGHLVHLSVSGRPRELWVNADSVDEALTQLGFSKNSVVSVSRSKRLPAGASNLSITPPKHVIFKVDGKSVPVLSAGPTVFEAIYDAGIFLAPGDRMSAAGRSNVKEKQRITIQRASFRTSVEKRSVGFHTVTQKDATRLAGTTSVLRPGREGLKQITYQLVYLDGKVVAKVARGSITLSKPVDQIKKTGTKKAPGVSAAAAAAPGGDARAIGASLVSARGWGSDQFSCLTNLWNRESMWRVDALNPSGAYGIPQSLPGNKMASAGADWQTNPVTQITWGLGYIKDVYGTPCAAWGHSEATNWY
jgi:uncharacterized protein YabE (DUF348 family)